MGLTAEDLRDVLRPDVDGEKSLLLKMIPGKRPEIVFTGTWTGKYIRAAMDSIAKSYRIQGRTIRRTEILPTAKVAETITQPKAEGRK